jgi:hypothetical protein
VLSNEIERTAERTRCATPGISTKTPLDRFEVRAMLNGNRTTMALSRAAVSACDPALWLARKISPMRPSSNRAIVAQ